MQCHFRLKKNLAISGSFLLLCVSSFAQRVDFSVATDLGVLRNFRNDQQFIAFGHTIQGQFHVAPKDAFYLWVCYYTNGKFDNDVTATAKLPATLPQEIDYTNKASMRLRQFSVGYRRYLKGNYVNEQTYSLYAYAGLGLLFAKVVNTHSEIVDTALYNLPVLRGERAFKRLTLDLGMGIEYPIGNAMFLYTEGRAWIPTTDYPSKHLYVNSDAPLCVMFNFGLRILFD